MTPRSRTAMLFLALGAFVAGRSASAQEPTTDQKNVLELPEFVITGAGTMGIQSERKMDVKDTWGLDSATRALLRPVVGNMRNVSAADSATLTRTFTTFPLVAHGQFGVYRTPEGWLQYDGAASAFDWSARVAGSATQGSAANAAASIVDLQAGAGWRVPDNVMAFGDGRAGLAVAINNTNYNLYGSATPTQQRALNAKHVTLGFDQDAGTTPFAFAATSGSAGVSDSNAKTDSYFALDGSGAIVAPHWTVRGLVRVAGYSAPVSHRNFSRLDFDAEYTVAPLRYAFGAGLFAAGNTMFDNHTELGPHASISYAIAGAELFAGLSRGMRDVSIATIASMNPFVSLGALDSIRFPVEQLNARVGLRTAESRMLAAEARLAYIRTATAPVFAPMENGRWSVMYATTSTMELSAEARWRAFSRTAVIADGALRSATMIDSSNAVPFVPVADAALTIDQSFSVPLELSMTAAFTGRRLAALDGTALPAFLLVNVDGAYAFTPHVSATLQLRNILNTRYELWPGYEAMRAFAAAGVTARF